MQEYPERAAGNVPFRPRPFMSSHPPSSSSASSSSRTPRSGSSRPPPLPHPTVFTGYPPAFPVSVSPFDHQHQHLTHLPNGYQGFVIESYPGAPSPTAKTSPPALLQHSANGSPPTISYAYSPHSATAYFQPPGQQEPLALPPSTSTASPSSLSSSAYLVSYPPHLLSPLPPPSPVPGGPGGLVTQQLSIPKKFVGHIIGKGGRSIAEIRGTSGCDVQIADAGSGQNGDAEDRLVTITGSHPGTQAAIQMIYAKMKV